MSVGIITSEKVDRWRRVLPLLAHDQPAPVTPDELDELLQAHEELETAVKLLRERADDWEGYCFKAEGPDDEDGIPTPVKAPVDGCECLACCTVRFVAAHAARTGAAAREGGDSE